jgi:predicted nucleic acid-binding protein
MAIFLDSGFYMALIYKLDENHKQALKILSELKTGEHGQIYTSNFIMAESSVLVAIRTDRNPTAIEKMEQLFIGDVRIATILRTEPEIEKEIWNLFKKINTTQQNKNKYGVVSFVDCSNIILCKTHGIDKIASFDEHFKPWLQVIQ